MRIVAWKYLLKEERKKNTALVRPPPSKKWNARTFRYRTHLKIPLHLPDTVGLRGTGKRNGRWKKAAIELMDIRIETGFEGSSTKKKDFTVKRVTRCTIDDARAIDSAESLYAYVDRYHFCLEHPGISKHVLHFGVSDGRLGKLERYTARGHYSRMGFATPKHRRVPLQGNLLLKPKFRLRTTAACLGRKLVRLSRARKGKLLTHRGFRRSLKPRGRYISRIDAPEGKERVGLDPNFLK